MMNIRHANKVDAQRCGRILYDAFNDLAEKHNFPHKRVSTIARFVSTRSSGLSPANPCRCCKDPSPMPSLPVTMSALQKNAMLRVATSCVATFTALTEISSCAMQFAPVRRVWSYTWKRSRDMQQRLASLLTPSPAQIKI